MNLFARLTLATDSPAPTIICQALYIFKIVSNIFFIKKYWGPRGACACGAAGPRAQELGMCGCVCARRHRAARIGPGPAQWPPLRLRASGLGCAVAAVLERRASASPPLRRRCGAGAREACERCASAPRLRGTRAPTQETLSQRRHASV